MLRPIYTRTDAKDEQSSEQIAIEIDHQDSTNTLASNESITSSLSTYEERALRLAHIMASKPKATTQYPSLKTLISNLATVVLNELSDSLSKYHPQLFALYQQFPSLSKDIRGLLDTNHSLEERLTLANRVLKAIGIGDHSEVIELLKLIIQFNITIKQLIDNGSNLEVVLTLTRQIQTLLHAKIIVDQLDSQIINTVTNAISTIQQLISAVQTFQHLPNDATYSDYFNVLTGIGVIDPIISYVQEIVAVVIDKYKSSTALYTDLKALYYDSNLSLTKKINEIISVLQSNQITKDITKEYFATSIDYLQLALGIYDKTQDFLKAITNFEGNKEIFKEINTLVAQVKDIAAQINNLDIVGELPYFKALQYGLDQVQLGIGIANSLEELEPSTSYQQYFSTLINHPHLKEVIAESAQPLLKLVQTLHSYWLQAKDVAQFKSHPEFNKLQDYFNRYPAKADSNKKLAWLAEGFNHGWVVNLIASYLPPQITTQLERVYAFQAAIKDFPVHESFLKQSLWALDKLGTHKLGEITSEIGGDTASLDLLYALLKAYDSKAGYKSIITQLLTATLSNQRIQQQLIEKLFPSQTGQVAALATSLVQETVKLYKQDTFTHSWDQIFNAFFEVLIKQAKQNAFSKDIVTIVEDIKKLGTTIREKQWQEGFYAAFNLATNSKLSTNLAFAKGIYNLLQVFYSSYQVWINASSPVKTQEEKFKALTTSLYTFSQVSNESIEYQLINLLNYLPALNEVVAQYRQLPTSTSWLQWLDQLTGLLINSQSQYIQTTYQSLNQQLGEWIAQQLIKAPQKLQEGYSGLDLQGLFNQPAISPSTHHQPNQSWSEVFRELPWLDISLGLSSLLLGSYGAYQAYQAFRTPIKPELKVQIESDQSIVQEQAQQPQSSFSKGLGNTIRRGGRAATAVGLGFLFDLINPNQAFPLPLDTSTDLPASSTLDNQQVNESVDPASDKLAGWDLPPSQYLWVGSLSAAALTALAVVKLRQAIQRNHHQSTDIETSQQAESFELLESNTNRNAQIDFTDIIIDNDDGRLEEVVNPLLATDSRQIISLGEEIGESSDDVEYRAAGTSRQTIGQRLYNNQGRIGWVLATLFALGGVSYSAYGIYRHYTRTGEQKYLDDLAKLNYGHDLLDELTDILLDDSDELSLINNAVKSNRVKRATDNTQPKASTERKRTKEEKRIIAAIKSFKAFEDENSSDYKTIVATFRKVHKLTDSNEDKQKLEELLEKEKLQSFETIVNGKFNTYFIKSYFYSYFSALLNKGMNSIRDFDQTTGKWLNEILQESTIKTGAEIIFALNDKIYEHSKTYLHNNNLNEFLEHIKHSDLLLEWLTNLQPWHYDLSNTRVEIINLYKDKLKASDVFITLSTQQQLDEINQLDQISFITEGQSRTPANLKASANLLQNYFVEYFTKLNSKFNGVDDKAGLNEIETLIKEFISQAKSTDDPTTAIGIDNVLDKLQQKVQSNIDTLTIPSTDFLGQWSLVRQWEFWERVKKLTLILKDEILPSVVMDAKPAMLDETIRTKNAAITDFLTGVKAVAQNIKYLNEENAYSIEKSAADYLETVKAKIKTRGINEIQGKSVDQLTLDTEIQAKKVFYRVPAGGQGPHREQPADPPRIEYPNISIKNIIYGQKDRILGHELLDDTISFPSNNTEAFVKELEAGKFVDSFENKLKSLQQNDAFKKALKTVLKNNAFISAAAFIKNEKGNSKNAAYIEAVESFLEGKTSAFLLEINELPTKSDYKKQQIVPDVIFIPLLNDPYKSTGVLLSTRLKNKNNYYIVNDKGFYHRTESLRWLEQQIPAGYVENKQDFRDFVLDHLPVYSSEWIKQDSSKRAFSVDKNKSRGFNGYTAIPPFKAREEQFAFDQLITAHLSKLLSDVDKITRNSSERSADTVAAWLKELVAPILSSFIGFIPGIGNIANGLIAFLIGLLVELAPYIINVSTADSPDERAQALKEAYLTALLEIVFEVGFNTAFAGVENIGRKLEQGKKVPITPTEAKNTVDVLFGSITKENANITTPLEPLLTANYSNQAPSINKLASLAKVQNDAVLPAINSTTGALTKEQLTNIISNLPVGYGAKVATVLTYPSAIGKPETRYVIFVSNEHLSFVIDPSNSRTGTQVYDTDLWVRREQRLLQSDGSLVKLLTYDSVEAATNAQPELIKHSPLQSIKDAKLVGKHPEWDPILEAAGITKNNEGQTITREQAAIQTTLPKAVKVDADNLKNRVNKVIGDAEIDAVTSEEDIIQKIVDDLKLTEGTVQIGIAGTEESNDIRYVISFKQGDNEYIIEPLNQQADKQVQTAEQWKADNPSVTFFNDTKVEDIVNKFTNNAGSNNQEAGTGKLKDEWQIKDFVLEESWRITDSDVYKVRSTTDENEWDYYIKQDGKVYKVRWDDNAWTLRIINPAQPGRFNYGVPIKKDQNNRWVTHLDLPGKGGANRADQQINQYRDQIAKEIDKSNKVISKVGIRPFHDLRRAIWLRYLDNILINTPENLKVKVNKLLQDKSSNFKLTHDQSVISTRLIIFKLQKLGFAKPNASQIKNQLQEIITYLKNPKAGKNLQPLRQAYQDLLQQYQQVPTSVKDEATALLAYSLPKKDDVNDWLLKSNFTVELQQAYIRQLQAHLKILAPPTTTISTDAPTTIQTYIDYLNSKRSVIKYIQIGDPEVVERNLDNLINLLKWLQTEYGRFSNAQKKQISIFLKQTPIKEPERKLGLGRNLEKWTFNYLYALKDILITESTSSSHSTEPIQPLHIPPINEVSSVTNLYERNNNNILSIDTLLENLTQYLDTKGEQTGTILQNNLRSLRQEIENFKTQLEVVLQLETSGIQIDVEATGLKRQLQDLEDKLTELDQQVRNRIISPEADQQIRATIQQQIQWLKERINDNISGRFNIKTNPELTKIRRFLINNKLSILNNFLQNQLTQNVISFNTYEISNKLSAIISHKRSVSSRSHLYHYLVEVENTLINNGLRLTSEQLTTRINQNITQLQQWESTNTGNTKKIFTDLRQSYQLLLNDFNQITNNNVRQKITNYLSTQLPELKSQDKAKIIDLKTSYKAIDFLRISFKQFTIAPQSTNNGDIAISQKLNDFINTLTRMKEVAFITQNKILLNNVINLLKWLEASPPQVPEELWQKLYASITKLTQESGGLERYTIGSLEVLFNSVEILRHQSDNRGSHISNPDDPDISVEEPPERDPDNSGETIGSEQQVDVSDEEIQPEPRSDVSPVQIRFLYDQLNRLDTLAETYSSYTSSLESLQDINQILQDLRADLDPISKRVEALQTNRNINDYADIVSDLETVEVELNNYWPQISQAVITQSLDDIIILRTLIDDIRTRNQNELIRINTANREYFSEQFKRFIGSTRINLAGVRISIDSLEEQLLSLEKQFNNYQQQYTIDFKTWQTTRSKLLNFSRKIQTEQNKFSDLTDKFSAEHTKEEQRLDQDVPVIDEPTARDRDEDGPPPARRPRLGLRLPDALKLTLRKTPIVVAQGRVAGKEFTDVNPKARPASQARSDQPTLIADQVRNRPSISDNSNMGRAHAEIGVIEQAYREGLTQGREMEIDVEGRPVCTACLGDLAKEADAAGLASLKINELETGKVLVWEPGDNRLKPE